MSNYKEKNITGKKHQRYCRVVIEDPYKGLPSIMFVEEEIIEIGEEVTTKLVSNISVVLDPAASFPGVDPETDVPAGRGITHGEVQALLYSLYKYLTTQRDQKGK